MKSRVYLISKKITVTSLLARCIILTNLSQWWRETNSFISSYYCGEQCSQCSSELIWRSTCIGCSIWLIESQHVLRDECGTQPGSKRGLSAFKAINKEFTHSISAFRVVHNGAYLAKWVRCVWGLGARHNEILMEHKDLIFPKLSSIIATVQLWLPHL